MLMERELNKGGKTDEKIQSIGGSAACGDHSVGREGENVLYCGFL